MSDQSRERSLGIWLHPLQGQKSQVYMIKCFMNEVP